MTITIDTARSLARGHGKAYDAAGDRIGTVGQVYVDDETGEPNWVTVHTGLFGVAESFVPLHGARVDGADLHLPHRKDQVKDAPRIEPDGSLTPDEEERLFSYYTALPSSEASSESERHHDRSDTDDAGRVADDVEQQPAGGTRENDDTDREPGSLQPSEQRLRLRRYVVTEEATITVPVQREEVRLEPEPDDDLASRDDDGDREDVGRRGDPRPTDDPVRTERAQATDGTVG